ncbi:MAG: M67 family metallopeptidase [Phycisphaerae bacterium]|nr:M67 family metallopeptidase [Phycisphaerae bacterium]
MDTLEIPEHIFSKMLSQARAEAPLEACGILAGTDNRVQRLYKMTNTDQSSEHFMMAAEEQFAVMKDMRAKGLEILAIYHSHPNSPARPSKEDIRLAFTDGVLYVVLSLQEPSEPRVRAFNIDDGVISESKLEIVEVDCGSN